MNNRVEQDMKKYTAAAGGEAGARPIVYICTAVLVFVTIYTLGLRIDIFTTAFDMIQDSFGFIYFYGFMIIGCGLTGLGMIVYMLVNGRKKGSIFKAVRTDIVLLAVLLLWMFFSAFMNRDLGFRENLSGVITISVTVVCFYLIGREFDKNELGFILKRVILWGSLVWNIGCVISLVMYLANYRGYYKFGGFIRRSRQGIMEGRLFGCFSDPNYAAMISLLLMGGLIYLCYRFYNRENKAGISKAIRIYCYTSMVIYALYIILSGSRSSYTALILTTVVVVWLRAYRMRKLGLTSEGGRVAGLFNRVAPTDKDVVRAYILRPLIVVGLMLALYFALVFGLQTVGAAFSPERDTETELERDDVSVENISNSRFDIWLDYLGLVRDRPVYGFSSRGALIYSAKKNPDSYISEKGYNPHSMFVQMLVQTGTVGLLLLMVFLLRMLLLSIKRCRAMEPIDLSFYLGLFWVLIHGVYCVFNVGIFITPCFEAMLAWIGFGIMEQNVRKDIGDTHGNDIHNNTGI